MAALEIKASAMAAAEDFRHLARFRDRLGASFANGVVLYTGARALSFGDRLTALPVAAVWD